MTGGDLVVLGLLVVAALDLYLEKNLTIMANAKQCGCDPDAGWACAQHSDRGDRNKHAGHYADYGFIDYDNMPAALRDEWAYKNEMSNDTGKLFWPTNHPEFKAWLESEGMPTDTPYFVYVSW